MNLVNIIEWLLLFILSLLELRRAWIILIKKEIGYFTGARFFWAILRAFAYDKQVQFLENLNKDTKRQKNSGYIGLIAGTLVLLSCLISITDVIDGLNNYIP